jgi:hypothetical protein
VATSELAQRFTSARIRASELTEQSRALTEAAKQAFDTATRLKAARRKREIVAPGPDGAITRAEPEAKATEHLRTFELEGLIDDMPVRAAALDGVLVCDPLLRAHAEVVVALGEALPDGLFPQGERASLDSSPAVMLATLMRAVRVTKLRVGFGGSGSSQV